MPIAEASIPITDWGFLRSDATYDVVTVWEGAFFRLDAHLERFARSCQSFRLDPGLSPAQITGVLERCVRLSGLRSAYVEMIATRGQPPWGSRDPRQAVNQFYAFAVPYVWIANDAQRERGLNLVVSEVQRIPASSVDPRAKNYHWNDLTMGLLGALDRRHHPAHRDRNCAGGRSADRAAGPARARTSGRARGICHQLGRRRAARDAHRWPARGRRPGGPGHAEIAQHLLGLAP